MGDEPDEYEQYVADKARSGKSSQETEELLERVRQLIGGEIPALPEPHRYRALQVAVLIVFVLALILAFGVLAVWT